MTDNASNFKVALTGYHRLPCACHMVATVLNHTLQLSSVSKTVEKINESSSDIMYVTEIREAVANVKNIVAYFKRTGLNNKLSVSLKQSNETRWNSTLLMLKTFNELRKNTESVLNESGQEQRLVDVNWTVIEILMKFLTPFQTITDILLADKLPTIHKVHQCYHKVMTSMAASLTDTPLLQFLKNRGISCLKQKFEIHDLHILALFLNPKYKSLIPISEAKRQGIQRLAKDLLSTQSCDSMESVICISEGLLVFQLVVYLGNTRTVMIIKKELGSLHPILTTSSWNGKILQQTMNISMKLICMFKHLLILKH